MNPQLVEATRGGIVESAHRGALVVVDAHGKPVCAIGDTERPVFARSAVKVLQALPLVTSGAADAFKLTDEELALACASHNGEARHVATAAGVLAKAGLDETALECGAHWPQHEVAQRELALSHAPLSALHNNCSGKHAGFLCVGCMMARAQGREAREFVRGYVKAEHPVMREISASMQDATGCDLSRAPVGTDGCSIPTFGIPLHHLAHAFAKVATGIGLSADLAHHRMLGLHVAAHELARVAPLRARHHAAHAQEARVFARARPRRRDQSRRRQQRARCRGGDGCGDRGVGQAR